MNLPRAQVERFYRDLWDNQDKAAIPEVLHPDFAFRGSLGQEKRGHGGFAEYVGMVHEALGDYKCVIDDLVVESPKAFARMTFTGVHRAPFLTHFRLHIRSFFGCHVTKNTSEMEFDFSIQNNTMLNHALSEKTTNCVVGFDFVADMLLSCCW